MDERRELLLTGRTKLVAGSLSPNSGQTQASIDNTSELITSYMEVEFLNQIVFLGSLDESADQLEQSFV